MRTALKVSLWLAFVLEILSGIIWLLTIFYVLPAFPLSATVALFIIHIKSYKEIMRYGKISAKNIQLQTIFGSIIAVSLTLIVFTFTNMDCMDVCTHPPNYVFTHSIPIALFTLFTAMFFVLLPAYLNKRLASSS